MLFAVQVVRWSRVLQWLIAVLQEAVFESVLVIHRLFQSYRSSPRDELLWQQPVHFGRWWLSVVIWGAHRVVMLTIWPID